MVKYLNTVVEVFVTTLPVDNVTTFAYALI